MKLTTLESMIASACATAPWRESSPSLTISAEIIHGIEKHVVQFRHFGLDISRDGQIHHEDRAMLACLDGALQHAFAEYGKRAGCACHHDIVQRQLFGQLVQRDDVRVETAGQGLRTLDGAIGNSDALRMARSKMAGAQLDHFARADEQVRAARQYRQKSVSASRVAAAAIETEFAPISVELRTSLATKKGALKQLVQQHAERAGMFGRLHGIFQLAEYLRLAQHHGIQSAGHAKGVLHCFFARQLVKIRLELAAPSTDENPPASALPPPAFQYCNKFRYDCRSKRSPLPLPGRRPTRSRKACSMASSGNATCSRTSSGAVWWLMPKANNCMEDTLATGEEFENSLIIVLQAFEYHHLEEFLV